MSQSKASRSNQSPLESSKQSGWISTAALPQYSERYFVRDSIVALNDKEFLAVQQQEDGHVLFKYNIH